MIQIYYILAQTELKGQLKNCRTQSTDRQNWLRSLLGLNKYRRQSRSNPSQERSHGKVVKKYKVEKTQRQGKSCR